MSSTSAPTPAPRAGREWLNQGLVVIIALALLTMFGVIFQTMQVERAEREQVQTTTRALVLLRNINRAAINLESGQRGYLITLDPEYLEPYSRGRAELLPSLNLLRETLARKATPRQDELLDTIERAATAKIEVMEETVILAQAGEVGNARDRVRTDQSRDLMVELQGAVRELEVLEQDILDRALTDAQSAETRTPWLVLGLLVMVILLLILVLRLIRKAADAQAEAAQASALATARDRADLLAGELNHRVKNLFAMILAIVQMSGRDAPSAQPVLDIVGQRVRALLKAHEVTQGSGDEAFAPLRALVETTLSPYLSKVHRAEIDGPQVLLPARLVTPLGLVLHELTTNAIKYGAWAHSGAIKIDWYLDGNLVIIDWREDGLSNLVDTQERGFGSQLMRGAAQQLGGSIDRVFKPQGCQVHIRFPLKVI
ncbi:sensor histidine kinase [Altererythrobacter sp. GH1-8]|uniref:sensor histidine kinase n=1 Tax=Altererythrobacter sp. GH1-8 TaxID=3349333 RepID=UPI00374CB175